ncbi:MAG: hypothetical protein DRQ58_06780 [Gammaproteobacteria bacterium]|nr:MAG: hypothetical protein DRQ58_06780 [Gammaproteobacteria bacterium]
MRLFEIKNWDDTSWTNGKVTLSIKDLLNGPLKDVSVKKLKVKDLAHMVIDSAHDDSSRIDKADLQYPIIIVVDNGKYKYVLDGNHRLAKAVKHDLPTIDGKILDLSTLPDNHASLFR